MAMNDDAVLTAAVGYVYTAAVGTAAPTPAALPALNLDTPSGWAATGWTSVGHTSRNKLPEFGFDGGKSEVRGSWQKKKLREVTTEDPVDHLTVVLNQFDEGSLALYYGANASATAGVFGVASSADPAEKAFLVIIVDGTERLGFTAPKASVKRDDSIDLPIDDLAALPVKATFLDYLTEPLFSWINEDLFNPVVTLPHLALGGATAGGFTLKLDGVETGSISVSGISTSTIQTALAAVDDGLDAADITVTSAAGGYDIDVAAVLTLGTDSTTGGTGVVLT